MSIEQEIARLVDAKAAFKSWLTAKGVSVPKDALLPSMVDLLARVLPHTDRTALFPFRESRMWK